MENITEPVRRRRSVRIFDGKEVTEDDREKLTLFMEKIENPYGIPVSFKFLDGKKQSFPCPVVIGTDLYVGQRLLVCRIWRRLLDILLRGSCYMHNLLELAQLGLAVRWAVPLLSVQWYWNRMK